MVEEQFVKYSSPPDDKEWVKMEIQSLLEMIEMTNVRIRESISVGIHPESLGIESFIRFKGQLIEQLMELLNEFDLGIQSVKLSKAA